MNVAELVAHLEDMIETHEGFAEREILLAHQPAWPLQEIVGGVFDPVIDDEEFDRTEFADSPEEYSDTLVPVYLVAGGAPYDRSPYAPSVVFSA